MKPKINLEDPIIRRGLELITTQTRHALNTPQEVEKAIIPIYAIPTAKKHQKPKRKPEQFGSGVLLKIKDQFFILSSTHLFEGFEGYVLLTGSGKGSQIEYLSGERFSSGKVESPYLNQLDATVFHIQSALSKDLEEVALSLDDLEFENDETEKPIYLMSGFRVKKSNTSGNTINSKREAFPSQEVSGDTYKLYNIDNKSQFILAYEDDILVNGAWQKSPIPRGFSGGGVIKIEGTDILNPLLNITKTNQKLRAIITEQHRQKNNKPGILISTKINVHIGLIYQFLPNLFD